MAVVTTPIMTPLADLLEMHRQTAVPAYRYGITNLILPSYAALIGAPGLTRVPFSMRFRFIWLLTLILLAPAIALCSTINSCC